jgi:hypothetical protein
MKTYEIINPSDPYTIEAESFKTACVAVCLLGNGQWAVKSTDEKEEMPMFLFGGHDEWFEMTFGEPFKNALDSISPKELSDCLGSVVIGSPTQRIIYYKTLALIDDPAKKQAYREHWHNKYRSSMNDIGRTAWAIASKIAPPV